MAGGSGKALRSAAEASAGVARRPAAEPSKAAAHATGGDAPALPAWALSLTPRVLGTKRVPLDDAGAMVAELTVREGADSSIVSVELHGLERWSEATLGEASEAMIGLSLEELAKAPFAAPVRLWNFLPGICEPIGEGLDRYRVFNMARHRVFTERFGAGAVKGGALPTASCVGHRGRTIAVHAMGGREDSTPIENPRQVPAFAYSKKFGPKPPCFSRAGLAVFGTRRLLLVAGTASVLGEESMHAGDLGAQLRETMVNLRAVVGAGLGRGPQADDRSSAGGRGDPSGTRHVVVPEGPGLDRVLATRVYCRDAGVMRWMREHLPVELRARELEFILADICRDELLVEIEIVVDAGRG